jgi:hypothetical protein
LIKVIRYSDLANYKPQKPPHVVQHTYVEALEKTLDLMSVGHAFKKKRYDPTKEKLTLDLLIKLCGVLNLYEVNYMIVGGTAVGFYEYTGISHPSLGRVEIKTDIDVWYLSSYKNRIRIVESLKVLSLTYSENDAQEMSLFSNATWVDMLVIEQTNFQLNFIPYSGRLEFNTSVQNAKIVELTGVTMPFIGYDDLIKTMSLESNPRIDDLDVSNFK